jgi:superfamily II DNA helicase RecQ
LAYTSELVAQYQRQNVNLLELIRLCDTWQTIFVDPEHLSRREWKQICASSTFRSNLSFGITDEAHLIDDWGPSFRQAFKLIGVILRSRLSSHASISALTATLPPSKVASICQSMGFFDGTYHFLRYSNERLDRHLDLQILPRGGRSSYSFLTPYISLGRKTIIHVRTIDDVYRCFMYLSRATRPSERLIRFRMYHAALPDEYNNETLVFRAQDESIGRA